jgi:hypothetical protein
MSEMMQLVSRVVLVAITIQTLPTLALSHSHRNEDEIDAERASVAAIRAVGEEA